MLTIQPPRAPLRTLEQPPFLPISPGELKALGWMELDVLLMSGDAYVDHPSFAMALLGRCLVTHGFTVAILPQPAWQGEDAVQSLRAFPRPRLFAGIGAGSVDSMLAHYTAFRKKRSDDAYTPGGKAGARPNRASVVYTGLARQAFPGLPVVLGGIEASLRRFSHYDFWADDLRRSLLLDSKADLILCGMAEDAIVQAAWAAHELLADADHARPLQRGTHSTRAGQPHDALRKRFAAACRHIPGAVTVMSRASFDAGAHAPPLSPEDTTHPEEPNPQRAVLLPSHEAMQQEPAALLHATVLLERISHQGLHYAVQHCGDRSVLMAPPAPPTSPGALDAVYDLPFARLPHPLYKDSIPAWEMIRTSITTHRGCAGGCSFCSLALHQGRLISSRSKSSILREAACIAAGPQVRGKPHAAPPKWAGSISDVGGPSANMWQARCSLDSSRCRRASCLFPAVCPGFQAPQREDVKLLRDVAAQPGVRHVRVASGVRYDLALQDMDVLRAYSMEFTGGQLKIAPEHICDDVLRLMRKPSQTGFETFLNAFAAFSREAGKEQYIIPYLISAFPGCTDAHMHTLKRWLEERGWSPKQVQCFIPTPGTVATAMFYCGQDTDGHAIPVARTDKARMHQHYILLGEGAPEKRHPRGRDTRDTHETRQPRWMKDTHSPRQSDGEGPGRRGKTRPADNSPTPHSRPPRDKKQRRP